MNGYADFSSTPSSPFGITLSDIPPFSSLSGSEGSSCHTQEFNYILGGRGSSSLLGAPLSAIPPPYLHAYYPVFEDIEFSPPLPIFLDIHPVPMYVVQDQWSDGVTDPVPEHCAQEHAAFTAIDPIVSMRSPSTNTGPLDYHINTGSDASPPSLHPPHPDLSSVSRRPRRPRNNNRRKEKVICGVNGCRRVVSRDSLRRHTNEVHMGLKRSGKGKAGRDKRGV